MFLQLRDRLRSNQVNSIVRLYIHFVWSSTRFHHLRGALGRRAGSVNNVALPDDIELPEQPGKGLPTPRSHALTQAGGIIQSRHSPGQNFE